MKRKLLPFIFVGLIFFMLTACSPKPYTITQYGDPNGSPESFYSILTPENKLILIDGGFNINEENVRNVIAEHNNVVDAWILTHPHPDHIGAFNNIFENPQGIEINHIYATDIDYDYYNEKKQEWDQFEVYEKFLELTADSDNLTYLYENDKLNIEGLNVTVLHSANNATPDPANDGSLILKMEGDEESILFTGDTGAARSDYLLQNHRDELKSDYLQMAHHGNGGLNDEVYDAVSPKIAFADCPDWLKNNINPATGLENNWTTPERIAFIESLGGEVLTFTTAPNTISLY